MINKMNNDKHKRDNENLREVAMLPMGWDLPSTLCTGYEKPLEGTAVCKMGCPAAMQDLTRADTSGMCAKNDAPSVCSVACVRATTLEVTAKHALASSRCGRTPSRRSAMY